VKHLRPFTKRAPEKAELWQEIICSINHLVFGLITAKGGAAPVSQFVDQKCDIPVPNTDSGDTSGTTTSDTTTAA
jgi:hypothetical protein